MSFSLLSVNYFQHWKFQAYSLDLSSREVTFHFCPLEKDLWLLFYCHLLVFWKVEHRKSKLADRKIFHCEKWPLILSQILTLFHLFMVGLCLDCETDACPVEIHVAIHGQLHVTYTFDYLPHSLATAIAVSEHIVRLLNPWTVSNNHCKLFP